MFDDPAATLEDAARALRERTDWVVEKHRSQISDNEYTSFLIVRDEGHEVSVGLADEPHILVESAEIAERYAADRPFRDKMAQSPRRFEIIFEMRVDMENFNTVFLIEHGLQKVLKNRGITFDCGSEMFPGLD